MTGLQGFPRRAKLPGILAALFLGAHFLIAAAPGARASTDPAELTRNAIEDLGQAHEALVGAQRASDRVEALSRTIRALEEGLDALREGVRRSAVREAQIRSRFDAQSEQISRLLGVLMSIQSVSGPLALLHPSGPLDTVRSGMIVSEVTPALAEKADELRARLEEIRHLRRIQLQAEETLRLGLADIRKARTDLSQAISNRTDLPRRYLDDPQRLQRLIDSADTLESLASGLLQIDMKGKGPGSEQVAFSEARGRLKLPVAGTLLRRFNEADAAGVRRPGILIATHPQALVSNPWPATLRYRGPLPGYGIVVILEPDAGSLLILAGLAQAWGEVGDVLEAGAPLGIMGGEAPDAEGFFQNAVNGTGPGQTETLYMELRLGEKPVDPAPWFALEPE